MTQKQLTWKYIIFFPDLIKTIREIEEISKNLLETYEKLDDYFYLNLCNFLDYTQSSPLSSMLYTLQKRSFRLEKYAEELKDDLSCIWNSNFFSRFDKWCFRNQKTNWEMENNFNQVYEEIINILDEIQI